MTPAESTHVAVELEKLRGTLEAGFARVDGSLALLVQRSDQTDRQLSEQRDALKHVEERVDGAEANIKVLDAASAAQAAKSTAQEIRLSAVEKLGWTALGVGLVGSAAASILLPPLFR
ncbi:hypothetical protein ACGFYE_18685 [Streptomyces zaomyceticus]|uniref:hypothetical protein n=1 Tax=Streptomyces zaomyceticus TaxID=68286 RepID=UPI00371C1594